MTVGDQNVLLVVSDPALKKDLLAELLLRRPEARANGQRGHYQVSISESLDEALERQTRATLAQRVVLLDQSALGPAVSLHAQWSRVGELAASAPVILIVEAGSVSSLNGLAARIADGRIEVVYRHGAFMPLVMALVARHSCTHPVEGPVADLRGPNFGEALRHELNNPLTGILGNAELLLAQRDKLPPGATDRLKTIADLAVHLRETVRRLSNAWEEHAARAREVEVQR
jgi:signal transduction histidine kinase